MKNRYFNRTPFILVNILFFLLITINLLQVTSCGSKDNIELKEDETNQILLAGTDYKVWIIESSKKNGIETLPDCIKDDQWIFKRNGQFSRESKTNSCNGLPDIETSKWSFGNNEEWLTFLGGTYEITKLSSDQMILKFPRPNGDIIIDTYSKE